tara:strand:+ start:614 stop:814 length:201 start_codon:yes stop_codon:yes gene_type:complete
MVKRYNRKSIAPKKNKVKIDGTIEDRCCSKCELKYQQSTFRAKKSLNKLVNEKVKKSSHKDIFKKS